MGSGAARGGGAARRLPWWWLVPSVALLAAVGFVLVTAWEPVMAGHPAYPATLVVAGALGLLGCVVSLRRR